MEVFPMTDDASAEIPQRTSSVQEVCVGSAPPGGTPVFIQDRDSDSTESLPGVELGEMVNGANSVDEESHRA